MQVAAMVLVLEYTLTIVSRSHGVPLGSASPAQMSTTASPSTVTAAAAPSSKPSSKFSTKASRTASKPSLHIPRTSMTVPLLVPFCVVN